MPLIVTGANHLYARTLAQFLRSVERHGEHRRFRWIIYDLGLSDSDRVYMSTHFDWARLCTADFSRYPAHVDVARRSYAWKPILIEEIARHHDGFIFWFDSATLLHRKLEEPLAMLSRNGIWSLRGQTALMARADSRVIQAFIESDIMVPEILHLPEQVTGAIGFDTRRPAVRRLLEQWAALARDPRYILPDNPDPRHRWEQTLFTALLLTAASRGEIQIGDEQVDISSTAPVAYLSTRNKLRSDWPQWADLPARAWYHVWKVGDRIALRAEKFWKTRVEGLLSGFREHYIVQHGEGGTIKGPQLGYLADPFFWEWKGEKWLFAERFDYLKNKGRLVAINMATSQEYPVSGEGRFSEIACHASFPFLLELEGELHMIPETHARRTVDLYQCVDFPGTWQLRKRLLADIDAADSMLIRKDGHDYLITSVKDGPDNPHLEIFFSRDLLTEALRPHPVNRQRRYAQERFGTGRCGGFLGHDATGRLLRFMQSSQHYYGQGGQWMEVTELSPSSFSERPLRDEDLPRGFPARPNSHHLSFGAGEFAWDVRDRVRTWP